MNGQRSVAVYIRGNETFVVPQAGGVGLRVEVEPVHTVTTNKDDLANALEEALEREVSLPQALNLRNYRSPVLSAARINSLGKFEQSVKYFTVKKAAGELQVQRFRRGSGGKGFEAEGEAILFPDSVPMATVAEKLLENA